MSIENGGEFRPWENLDPSKVRENLEDAELHEMADHIRDISRKQPENLSKIEGDWYLFEKEDRVNRAFRSFAGKLKEVGSQLTIKKMESFGYTATPVEIFRKK